MYFVGLVHFCAHSVLKRKHVSAAVKNYQACSNLDYRIQEAIIVLMIEAHREHPIYLEAQQRGEIVGITSLAVNFITWYMAGLASRDEAFIYYSSYVFGVGMLYRIACQAIAMADGLFCYILLLPCMGLFKLTAKHNLCYQCFLALAKLLSSPEEVGRALVANITVSLTGRPYHDVAADEALEIFQGRTKADAGSTWSPERSVVHTACGFFLSEIKSRFLGFKGGEDDDAIGKGQHVKGAHADTIKIVEKMRPMRLLHFKVGAPRAFGDLQVESPNGRLFPKGWRPPAAHLGIGHGGVLNWTAKFHSGTPLFAAQVSAAQEFLERAGVIPRSAGLSEQAGSTDAHFVTHCEVCTKALSSAASGGRVSCEACELVVCPGCVSRSGRFAPAVCCVRCQECLEPDEGVT